MFKESSNKSDTKSTTLAPANVPRKLTARDIAWGIGRKATDEELEKYLNRPSGKSILLRDGLARIKRKIETKAN